MLSIVPNFCSRTPRLATIQTTDANATQQHKLKLLLSKTAETKVLSQHRFKSALKR